MAQPFDPGAAAPREQWPSKEEVWDKWRRLCDDRGCNEYTCRMLQETFRLLDDFEYLADRDLDELLTRWDWETKTGKSATDRTVETSRLRQILVRLQAQRKASDIVGSASHDADLDMPLPQKTVQSRLEVFYARYRMTLPPRRMPSDRTIARTVREFEARALSVRPLNKIKAQSEVRTEEPRQTADIGKFHISTGSRDTPVEMRSEIDVLARFELYLTAMAIAGVTPLREAQPVPMGGDTSVEVVFPYDLAMRFKWMIEEALVKVPVAARRGWLLHMLEEEQAHWVYSVQFSTMTIGQIVAKSLVERRPLWFTPNAHSQPPPSRLDAPPPKRVKQETPRRNIFPPNMVVQPAPEPPQLDAAQSSRDRTGPKKRLASSALIKGKTVQLCRSFNSSTCDKADCKYEHRCSVVVGTRADGSDLVCLNGHSATRHGSGRGRPKGKGKGK